MAQHLPLQAITGGTEPSIRVAGTSGFAPDATTGVPLVKRDAHGKTNESGWTSILVSKACVVTIRYFNAAYAAANAGNGWVLISSAAAGYSKTFAAPGVEYFQAPPNSFFHIVSDTASTIVWHDGKELVTNRDYN